MCCRFYLVCKAPHCWAANENTFGAQGQWLQYITSCSDSSVQVDLDPALHRVHDLWQCVNLLTVEMKIKQHAAGFSYCALHPGFDPACYHRLSKTFQTCVRKEDYQTACCVTLLRNTEATSKQEQVDSMYNFITVRYCSIPLSSINK